MEEVVNRKVTYRLYPSTSQQKKLYDLFIFHQTLYNAALEHRIGAYKKKKVHINYYDQCKELTQLREECPEYARINAQSQQMTLKRLDRAYQSFFRRVKKGEKAGFPRFKSRDRFKGWGYSTHGDGWRLSLPETGMNGTLRISGVGHLSVRGRMRKEDGSSKRVIGMIKTMEILHERGQWFASVTFRRPVPKRKKGEEVLGIDWGTQKFLTIVNSKQESEVIENPRLLNQAAEQLKQAQRSLSRKKRGSCNRKRAKARLSKMHQKLMNQRHNHLHQTSAAIVKKAKHIATEKLQTKNMTKKPQAKKDEKGHYLPNRARAKAGLNRSILDSSPGKFFSQLRYKAAEAGIQWSEISTRKVKPSQTCSGCGEQHKKELSQRIHDCSTCGLRLDRDINAARVMIHVALTGQPYQALSQ